jgi:hypothetical protein
MAMQIRAQPRRISEAALHCRYEYEYEYSRALTPGDRQVAYDTERGDAEMGARGLCDDLVATVICAVNGE